MGKVCFPVISKLISHPVFHTPKLVKVFIFLYAFFIRDFSDASSAEVTTVTSSNSDEVYQSPQRKLCRVENGVSSLILDIAESLDNQINQTTIPKELAIVGNVPSEIELSLIYPSTIKPSKRYFRIKGKELRLNEPLDRDEDDLSSVLFQVLCSVKGTQEKRTIPVIVRISDLNDNFPLFTKDHYEVDVPESTVPETVIFRNIEATDADSGVNGLVQFSLAHTIDDEHEDGIVADEFFTMSNSQRGDITLNRSLDYERKPKHFITVLAIDRAFDPSQRKTSTATITVNVIDSDDQTPSFVQKNCPTIDGKCVNPIYNATVIRGVLSGILDVLPERIHAIDMDTIRAPIHYSFTTGSPSTFLDYFHIDPVTGTIRQVRPVIDDDEIEFHVIIKATEVSQAKRFATAQLHIKVLAPDLHRPLIHTNSLIGQVFENSPIGTIVYSAQTLNEPIKFNVTDDDLAPRDIKPNYVYELTTTAFRVNEHGILIVAEDHLDRDPPRQSELQFQIIAREVGHGFSSSSSPLVVTIKIQDINDNAPFILPMSPITIPGGDTKRTIIKVEGTDKDEGLNARIRFSLHHVSNNGNEKFTIDPISGMLSVIGKVTSGERYSITVQATDGGGRSSQSILEVRIVDGENARPPLFSQFAYDTAIAEGSTIGSEVMTLEAKDPEGKSVMYEIINGNDLQHFIIGKNTGVITVNADLDREDLSRYSLTVKAQDEGGLFSTTQVNIKILDIDDNNPILIGTPYEFHVKEGHRDKLIGHVEGKDLDEGENAKILYEVPNEAPIRVDSLTGDLYTRFHLDYEKEQTHYVVLTAKGVRKQSRIATATVTIHVDDEPDEMPVFKQFTYEVHIKENSPISRILQVEAFDPDTVEKRITYYIKQGPYDKFTIDPITGEIFATQRLDYEEASKHILIVGTEENDSGSLGSTTTVIINIIDENDIPPIFSVVPRPIRLEDTVRVGFILTQLQAVDYDGTSPGNKVKYELIGRGKSYRYFEIHPDTGVLSVKDDLRKEMDTEYQLDIRAYDLGEPSLDQVATVAVHVDHVATVPPDLGIGFADTEYTVEISENAPAGKIIKELVIVNKPDELMPISCEIRAGNDERLFELTTTKERNCLLRLVRSNLDFERIRNYNVQIQLVTLPGLISKKRSIANVKVKVLDENDNKAEFIVPIHQKVGRGKKLYAAIADDAQIATPILQVQANDADSGLFGEIRYDLEPSSSVQTSYFGIDPKSGIVKTIRTLDSISLSLLPFRLMIKASDSPSTSSNSHTSNMELIVNLISQAHRLVLVIEGISPDKAKLKEVDIIDVIQEISNLIIGIEKITPHYFYYSNGTKDVDQSISDVWFYAIDPISDIILERESQKVVEGVLANEPSKKIAYFVSSKLNVRVREIRKPLNTKGGNTSVPSSVSSLQADQQWTPFPITFVSLAVLIFIVTCISISIICYKWSQYSAFKNQVGGRFTVLQPSLSNSRYDTPYYIENSRSPSLKQYETQVLQMRVSADEGETGSDLQLDMGNHRNHVYNNSEEGKVRKKNGRNSIDCTDLIPGGIQNNRLPILRTFQSSGGGNTTLTSAAVEHHQPRSADDASLANPVYERSDGDDEDELEDGVISTISETNDNVHFQQSREYLYNNRHR